ncbi:MAG: EamA family transporter [Candidatus Aenigmarchaeota archaeon]|nr:EamA family transporter [Candidatus Aenigmarchaeota archaeon]
MTGFTASLLAVASTVVAAAGMVLFKRASGLAPRKMLLSPNFITGGALFVLGTILFILALKLDELSNLFPITSLTYIWVMLMSWKFLKEKPNKWKIAAVACIAAGIVLAVQ